MDSRQFSYTLRIPAETQYFDVSATATHPTLSDIRIYTMGTAGVDYPGGLPGYTTGKPLATNPRVNLYSLAANGGNTVDLVVTAADGVTRETYTIHIEQHGPGVYGEGWKPVVPTTAMVGARYGRLYAADDPLTTRVGLDPTVRDLTVIPALDISPPKFVSSFPRVFNPTSAAVELVVQLDEPGVVYYAVVPDGSRAPTSREVKEGSILRSDLIAHGAITSLRALTQEARKVVTGLASSTSYDVYFVAEDTAKDLMLEPVPNLQAAPTLLDFNTTV